MIVMMIRVRLYPGGGRLVGSGSDWELVQLSLCPLHW